MDATTQSRGTSRRGTLRGTTQHNFTFGLAKLKKLRTSTLRATKPYSMEEEPEEVVTRCSCFSGPRARQPRRSRLSTPEFDEAPDATPVAIANAAGKGKGSKAAFWEDNADDAGDACTPPGGKLIAAGGTRDPRRN